MKKPSVSSSNIWAVGIGKFSSSPTPLRRGTLKNSELLHPRIGMWKYVGNMKKYMENMKKYAGHMEKLSVSSSPNT